MCVKLCIHTHVCVRDWANRFTDNVIITTYCVPHSNSRENNEKTNPAHTILIVYVRKIFSDERAKLYPPWTNLGKSPPFRK